MTRLANQHDAIKLAQGFPNFPSPTLLKDAAVKAIRTAANELGHRETFRGYGPGPGYDVIRDAIAEHDFRGHGLDIATNEGDGATDVGPDIISEHRIVRRTGTRDANAVYTVAGDDVSPTGSTIGDNEFGGGPALSALISWARSNFPA